MAAVTAGSRTRRPAAPRTAPGRWGCRRPRWRVRPSRASRYGRPSQTVRPRAGPSVVSTVDVVRRDVDEVRDREVRDRDRVVDRRRRGEPDHCALAVEREVRELRGDAGRSACRVPRSACRRLAVEQRLVGDVEAHHRDRHAGSEHDVRGLGVGVDVELGGDRRVPLPDRAAHEATGARSGDELRVEPQQQGDVRERPDRRDRDRLGDARAGRGDERRRRPRGRAALGDGSRTRVADPALAVDLGRAHDRRRAARPAAPSATGTSSRAVGVEQPQRVLGAVADVGVAADGRDRQQVELRAARRRGRSRARRRGPGRCR